MLDKAQQEELESAFRRVRFSDETITTDILEEERSNFQKRFGPHALARRLGADLLSLMHDNQNPDCLFSWLNYTNNEEFSSDHFGEISGGSFWDLRVRRYNHHARWYLRNASNGFPEISRTEAISISLRNRRQLLCAVKLLDSFPDTCSDDDYENLQRQMDEVAPDISRQGWVHKYLSILFPEKIGLIHSGIHQRFHLQRLFLVPPNSHGPYASEGRFIRMARQMGLSLHNLSRSIIKLNPRPYNYWRMALPGCKKTDEAWRKCIENYSVYLSSESHEIRTRDVVLVTNWGRVFGICFVDNVPRSCPDSLEVIFLEEKEWRMPDGGGLPDTVASLNPQPYTIIECERRLQARGDHLFYDDRW